MCNLLLAPRAHLSYVSVFFITGVESPSKSKSSATAKCAVGVQTDVERLEKRNVLCAKCRIPISDEEESPVVKKESEEEDDDCMEGFEEDEEDSCGQYREEEEEGMDKDGDGRVTAWQCRSCPKVYKRRTYLVTHVRDAHGLGEEDAPSLECVIMTEEEFLRLQEAAEKAEQQTNDVGKSSAASFLVDKSKRKPIGKEWAPNSFSSTFTCYFCNEQFRKDYKLKLHLMLNHKGESASDMAKAREELTKSKLDGCVHRCGICGSRYNSVANFTRHIKDVHAMSRAEYRAEYGSSEVISRMFKCELCEKEVKHTRNIIGAHMKMVHLISWREYQEILIRLRQGETVGDLPAPELFECIICGVSVKYKREHLNKKHQITEDVYDELIAKKERGEDISDALPDREIFRCLICDRECMDIKKHIERSHQITEEMYEEIVATRAEESKRIVKQIPGEVSGGARSSTSVSGRPLQKHLEGNGEMVESPTPGASSNSNNGIAVSTDLQCYFGCDEFFKKDYQLYLHLKLKHRNEPPEELRRAYIAAEEEIALTRRSGSVYECALCKKQFSDNGAFYGHIQTKHSMQWREYKDRFGRCEIESAPFECKICGRVVKYDRNTVHTHLKNVHGINWGIYLDRIRKLRRGEEPDELPQIEMTECKVCSVNVKYLRDHLRNAHKITEQEYESLFNDEDAPSNPSIETPTLFRSLQDRSNTSMTSKQNEDEKEVSSSAPHPKPPKSDIQDKTNKKCSSCNITFDSRRSFIEHCTTVHNMKFKTKSGATISAMSVMKQQQQQQQTFPGVVKRKAENPVGTGASNASNYMQPFTPPTKALKTIFVSDGEFRMEESGSSKEGSTSGLHRGPQYTPTGVSKWNQCRYECCFCHRTTMSRSSMTSHIHNTHGIPIKEYKESSYPDIEVETNWFQCRLCSARTKFVKDCIAPHLKMSHNMDIETYERDVMQPEDWPEAASMLPRSTMRERPVAVSEQQFQLDQPTLEEAEEEEVVIAPAAPGNHVKEDKWNKCRFQCCLCEWMCADSRQMRSHIATAHGMNHEDYVREYGTTEVVTVRFRCELCNSEMKHCRQNIYAHMKDVHRISLAEYEERVGMNREEIGEPEDESQYEMPHQQSGPPAMMPLLDNGNQPSRWNRCRFQCAICHKLNSEKRHIREHVVKAHGMSMPEYESHYGDCEIHTEYFFCGVCHAEVKHNLKNISLHLNNVHQMTPQTYEAQFGRLPDDEVMIEGYVGGHPQQQGWHEQQEEEMGFGSHFLLVENGDVGGRQEQRHHVQPKATPPKSDVANPHCKFCRTCNTGFNRRQAFIEHCRNVHGMKIAFQPSVNNTSTPTQQRAPPAPSSSGGGATNLTCDYCGKVFSNRSNRNRHIILSCEVRKGGGGGGSGGSGDGNGSGNGSGNDNGSSQMSMEEERQARASVEEDDEDKASRYRVQEPQKCPFPDCEVSHLRSALLKRHLFEEHQIQNVSVQLKKSVKTEPAGEEEMDFAEETEKSMDEGDSGDERKVPPLRVKLSSLNDGDMDELDQEMPPSQTDDAVKNHQSSKELGCEHCSFKTNNAYILNRHQNACLKRKKSADEGEEEEEEEEEEDEGGEEEEQQHVKVIPPPEESAEQSSEPENDVPGDQESATEVGEQENGGISRDESEAFPVEEDVSFKHEKNMIESPEQCHDTDVITSCAESDNAEKID